MRIIYCYCIDLVNKVYFCNIFFCLVNIQYIPYDKDRVTNNQLYDLKIGSRSKDINKKLVLKANSLIDLESQVKVTTSKLSLNLV